MTLPVHTHVETELCRLFRHVGYAEGTELGEWEASGGKTLITSFKKIRHLNCKKANLNNVTASQYKCSTGLATSSTISRDGYP